MYMTIIFKHFLPNHLETRHGPSGAQMFIYIVFINDETGLTFTYLTGRSQLLIVLQTNSQLSVYRNVGPLVFQFNTDFVIFGSFLHL